MPAWSRQRPAWVKRKKRKAKRKKTRKKTSKKKGGTASHWLRELLKLLTGVQYPEDQYHYDPRHYSKDPEYKWSDQRTQAFKKEIPAPDVHSQATSPRTSAWYGTRGKMRADGCTFTPSPPGPTKTPSRLSSFETRFET